MVAKVKTAGKKKTAMPDRKQRSEKNQAVKKVKVVIKSSKVAPANKNRVKAVLSLFINNVPETRIGTPERLELEFVHKKPFEPITQIENIIEHTMEEKRARSLAENKPEQVKSGPDRWSECGQIFYTGGKAFGISSNLRSVCIGTPLDVDSFFQRSKVESDLTFLQRDTLKGIKQIRELDDCRTKGPEKEPIRKVNSRQVKITRLKHFDSKRRGLKSLRRPKAMR
jgi:hypothetical protein